MSNLEQPRNSNQKPVPFEIDMAELMKGATAPSSEDIEKARLAKMAMEESLGSPSIGRKFGSYENIAAGKTKEDAQEARAARLAQDKKAANEILSGIQKKAA